MYCLLNAAPASIESNWQATAGHVKTCSSLKKQITFCVMKIAQTSMNLVLGSLAKVLRNLWIC